MYKILVHFYINFIVVLLGFFLAINLSTILGQSGDWGIFSSGLISAIIEILSNIIYKTKKNLVFLNSYSLIEKLTVTLNFFNCLKIGILYGFFLESFKLGS